MKAVFEIDFHIVTAVNVDLNVNCIFNVEQVNFIAIVVKEEDYVFKKKVFKANNLNIQNIFIQVIENYV